jgi:hypothetical protein
MACLRSVRSLVGSSFVNRLCRRPRLVATLLLLVMLVAMQGGAVAEGGDLGVGTNENGYGNPGP